ncbi:cardiolipin synthase [Chelativorans sp. ZYF759]|uniref:phospholipase D-like domain-containing protein n=1 Tax=Chelativorans sp. ZYF759 TaxID=2692213 RepID=UPI00145E82C6|nr:phospholipase D-like domain-containing protein [Chelativorans sp. ZYF759]NMG39413.1 cardiolipin synthase [Chelativorans sp. ZYF759]
MLEALEGWWPYIVAMASGVIGITAAIHAAMTKEDPRAAIAWVGVILLSPFVGAGLYLVAGINRIRRVSIGNKRFRAESRHHRALHGAGASTGLIPPEARFQSMKKLGDRVAPFPLIGGNQIEPLVGGDAAYPAMLEAIRSARRHIALSSYIFDNDGMGRQFADALVAARQRGVEVRVLIDAVGARYSRPPIIGALREGGVSAELFLGALLGLRLPYANLRNHRKIMVVDGETSFTGGMNIRAGFHSDFAGAAVGRDMHFRVRGPVVDQLLAVFADDWSFTTGETLEGEAWMGGTARPVGKSAARCIVSGPDSYLAATHTMVMGAISVARHRIAICSPYFLPDQQLIGAIGVAARRGVEVDIVIPAANNLRLVDFAMTAQLDQVVAAGCRVWRTRGTFDHAKLMTVDGNWALLGSSNLDPRSLRLNFELDMEVFDADLVAGLDAHISARMGDAWQETLETLGARPFWKRLRNRVVWLASPYL